MSIGHCVVRGRPDGECPCFERLTSGSSKRRGVTPPACSSVDPDGAGLYIPGCDHRMDRHARKVASWRGSNTLNASFCVLKWQERRNVYRSSSIPTEGGWLTRENVTRVLNRHGIHIRMDRTGQMISHLFVGSPTVPALLKNQAITYAKPLARQLFSSLGEIVEGSTVASAGTERCFRRVECVVSSLRLESHRQSG